MNRVDLQALAEKELEKQQQYSCRLLCCGSTPCLSSGGTAVQETLKELFKEEKELRADLNVVSTGCMGPCSRGPLVTVQQLLPELAPEMARPTVGAVLFVDTRAVPPGETKPAVRIQPLTTSAASPGVGHHLTPAALLTYAGLLYGRQPPAWLVTAPGVDFSHRQGLSQTAQRALAGAGPAIARLFNQLDSALKILG